jgi:uncharacterized protein (TIGR01777 family)
MFRDEQVSGPFSRWIHTHRFVPVNEGQCRMEDEVDWQAPLGTLGQAFGGRFIEETLRQLFAFRHRRLAADLKRHGTYGDAPLTVAVTGATGLIGGNLSRFLTTGGHQVRPLVRGGKPSPEGAISWDPARDSIEGEAVEGVDAVVHLAGEPISGIRWTSEKKRAIEESRVQGTALLGRTLAALRTPPKILVSASAIGFYGNRGDAIITEKSDSGKGFLPRVCRAWEAATGPARTAGIRVVTLRTGVVLSSEGGVLRTMLLPFKVGIGGRVGGGRQYVSWIDLDDLVGLIHFALVNPRISGPLNATSPHPVTNATLATTLGRVLNRPTVVPLPSFAVRAIFGEMGQALLLDGARVLPRKAEEAGFEFYRPGLEESLRHQLGRVQETR